MGEMADADELEVEQEEIPSGYEVVRGTVEVEVATVVEKYVTDETKQERLENVVTDGYPKAPGARSQVTDVEVDDE